jgi:hypothetical protein
MQAFYATKLPFSVQEKPCMKALSVTSSLYTFSAEGGKKAFFSINKYINFKKPLVVFCLRADIKRSVETSNRKPKL